MYGFDGFREVPNFEESLRKTEIEAKVGKLKNRNNAGEDKVTGKII